MAQWHRLQELGSSRGLSFLYNVHRRLGPLPFRLLLAPVVAWTLLSSPLQRRASRQFLGRALGRSAGLRDIWRHFNAFAGAMLDKLVAWNNGIALEQVRFSGRESVAETLAQGRGLILVASHIGNMEVCRVLSKWREGLEIHVLVHTRHAENFNRVLRDLDPASHLNLHQVTAFDAALAAWMSQKVGEGAVLIIAGDRVPVAGGGTVKAPFLGQEAPFAPGPWILAHALACPVHLFFCLKVDAGFEVDFEPFEEQVRLPRGAGREPALQALVQRYAARLEHHAKRDPYQWFNFYPFWETPA
jgi:predicted LPLAT superfamily acyltransferase